MIAILILTAKNLPTAEFNTFIVQSATPALAVLPILASHGDGDIEFSTNVVTLSTILFIIVVPLVVTLLGQIGDKLAFIFFLYSTVLVWQVEQP